MPDTRKLLCFIIIVVFSGTTVLAGELQERIQQRVPPRPVERAEQLIAPNRAFIPAATETTLVWEESFEAEQIPWYGAFGWELTSAQSYKGMYSVTIDDSVGLISQLLSPRIDLQEADSADGAYFTFAVRADLPDFDGDGDDNLDDYYWIDLADYSSRFWHTSPTFAYAGKSWWCANSDSMGYENNWLQYLDSPQITLGENAELTFQLRYNLEAPEDIGGFDAWDGANVRISTDGGTTWDVLSGTPEYDFSSGYAWHFNGEGGDIPGWAGDSGEWFDASFDLSPYAGEEVIIRFALGSDFYYDVSNDNDLIGMLVDNILVRSGSDTILFDNAQDQTEMQPGGYVWKEHLYDYGEQSRPGGTGWSVYSPGMSFSDGPGLDLSRYAGSFTRLRWVAVMDNNHDGGDGAGLFLDDIRVWKYGDHDVSVNESPEAPSAVQLYANYPNPFNPTTTIRYALPRKMHVRLTVYNTRGQKVKVLVNRHQGPGKHHSVWNAVHLPAGLYVVRLSTGGNHLSRKVVLLK